MTDRTVQYCREHRVPVRMLAAVLNRSPHQASGGIHGMRGTGQTVWTCPTCGRQQVTSG